LSRIGGSTGPDAALGDGAPTSVPRDPLLAALRRREAAPRPRPTANQRAALIPRFTPDVRLLERLTGESYADWLIADHRGPGPNRGPTPVAGGEPAIPAA
jgi:hypothetical protein